MTPNSALRYKEIIRNALVIPEHKHWGAQTLGAGSIIAILDAQDLSPLGYSELCIKYVDVAGRETFGWLARQTPLREPKVKMLHNKTLSGDEGMSPIDWLRNRVMLDRQRDPDSGWTMSSWVAMFGHQHITEVRNAIRELGGIAAKTADADSLISRALRLMTNDEVRMSTEQVQETRAAATTKTKVAKKAVAKKAAAKRAEAAPGGRSMAKTAGKTLVPLLTKAGHKKGLSIAKALEAGKEVGKKQLTELRDAINESATTARDGKKDSLASQLSGANRIVRRLARQA